MIVVAPVTRVRILGVVPDVRLVRPDESQLPTVFTFTKSVAAGNHLAIRARADVPNVPSTVRETIARIWGSGRTGEGYNVTAWVASANAEYRARSVMLLLMALFSLPVAAVGLAGTVAHVCAERQYEFAVRLALGSTSHALRRLVLKQFAALAAVGLVTGVALALVLARSMGALLFGIASADTRVIGAVVTAMAAITAIAVIIPAAGATSFVNMRALKE